MKETEAPTIRIDLRGKSSADSALELRSESDDSDDQDDAYTWAQERKNIKREMMASTHYPSSSGLPHTPSPLHEPSLLTPLHLTTATAHTTTNHTSSSHSPSAQQHNLHRVSPDTKVENTGTSTHNVAATERGVATTECSVATTERSVAAAECNVAATECNVAATGHGVATTEHATEHNVTATEQVVADAFAMKLDTALSSVSNDKSNSSETRTLETSRTEIVRSSRQRTSDSLTLSSSVSDSEVTSSEGANCGGEQTNESRNTKKPSTGTGRKSKKQAKSKKTKKSQKKSQPQPSKEKTEKSLRRRAYMMQRIRNDSWNTSSDEENSLTPLTESSSETAFPELAGEKGEAVDTEKVKADLQKRILSKKPPAQFETPATAPIYHEDVSFGHQMEALHPNNSASGLLILSLSQQGLTAPWSELDIDTLVVLHCLVLTWLMYQATVDCSQSCTLASGNCVGEAFSTTKLPFRIAGLQQTVLDGQPSLLVAIQEEDGGKSCSGKATTNGSDMPHERYCEMEGILSIITLRAVLQPFLSLSTISDAISSSVISTLSGALSHPLSSLFGYQDDITPFTTPISFYWSSVYHPSSLPCDESLKSVSTTNTTVCTLSHASLGNPHFIYTVLSRVFSRGLDLAGIRLLFGEQSGSVLQVNSNRFQADVPHGEMLPTLALALRGPDAIYGWVDAVGPDDSALAKVTDPMSLSAVFGPGLVHTVKSPYQSTAALAKWFGGRACLKSGAVFGMSDAHTKSERRKRQRVRFSESESEDSIISPPVSDMLFPPLISNLPRLIAQAYSKSLLIVSPSVPPSCYSSVLASCSDLGFDVFGAKRIRLNGKRANALDISAEFLPHYTPSSTPPSPLILDSSQAPFLGAVFTSMQSLPPLPSVIIIIGRENAALHATTLKMLIMQNLRLLVEKNEHIEIHLSTSPDTVTHLIPYSEEKLKLLGSFSAPLSSGNGDQRVENESSKACGLQEEICFVAVPGEKSLPMCIDLLNKVFQVASSSSNGVWREGCERHHNSTDAESGNSSGCGGFELVGMKIIPQLSRFHAKKLCPLAVRDSLFSQAVQLLSGRPASLLIFRGMCCNQRILQHIGPTHGARFTVDLERKLQFIISRDLAEAVYITGLFFAEKELFSDSTSRVLTPCLPEAWIHEPGILHTFLHPQVKLWSVFWFSLPQLKLAVKVLTKLSRSGFAFAGISTTEVNMDCGDTTDDMQGSCVVPDACIAVCVEKTNAVWLLQHLLQPFLTGGRGVQAKKIRYSENFSCAVSDLRCMFPGGICTQVEQSTVMKDYNINTLAKDNFDNLALSGECLEKLKQESSSRLLSFVSPLLERTAIVLPSSFFARHGDREGVDDFIHVLDFLCQSKFDICGIKMVLFSDDRAKELRTILHDEIEFQGLAGFPCLVMLLERDNAASCFQQLIKSALQSLRGHSDMDKLLSQIIAPRDAKQAYQILSFFHVS